MCDMHVAVGIYVNKKKSIQREAKKSNLSDIKLVQGHPVVYN